MPKLLIIEDEAAFREFMALALQLEGYQVQSVADGETALQALEDDPPDLVLLDLSMPNLSGWDVLHHIRAVPELMDLSIVVLTANADEDTRRRSTQEHVDALLIKPVSLDEILETVENAL